MENEKAGATLGPIALNTKAEQTFSLQDNSYFVKVPQLA